MGDGKLSSNDNLSAARVLRGARSFAVSRILTQLAQFAIGVALARILEPAAFGTIAAINAVAGITFLISEGGLRSALVHARSPNETDYSTVFWINLITGIALTVALWALGPLIAQFFGEPVLAELAPIVALTFACSIAVVHASKMQRSGRFRTGALIEGASSIIGLLGTLAAALVGFGVFALAIGPVVTQCLVSTGYMIAIRWYPRHRPSMHSLLKLARFSAPLVGANTLDYTSRNIDTVLIGRTFGSQPLGLYNRGYNLVLLPLNQIVVALGTAVSPALASLQQDPSRAAKAYLRAFEALCLVMIPVMVGLAAVAPGLIGSLFGHKWDATVPVLQILCLAAIAQSVTISTQWVYQARHRTTIMLIAQSITTTATVIAVVVGLQWGIVGVAVAILIRSWITLPVEIHLAIRGMHLTAVQLAARGARIAVPSIAMGVIVWYVPELLHIGRDQLGTMLIQVAVGVSLQLGSTLAFNREVALDTLRLRGRGKEKPSG